MADLEIPKLILDPRNDDQLLAQHLQRTIAASGGKLTDTSPGSPLYALASGQVFSIAELLYYHNLLPEAIALEVIRLCGVKRKEGTFARGEITVLLEAPLSSNFLIPANTFLAYGNSGFYTTQDLVILPGAIDGTVPIVAAMPGSEFNLPALGLVTTSTGFTYAQSIYNASPITGGSDIEPLKDTIARAQAEIRSRDVLVSVTDYERAAVEIMGRVGLAKAIPRLSANKTSYETGQVHVFVCDADGKPLPTATTQFLQEELQSKSFAASRTWVSSVKLQPLQVEAIVSVQQVSQAVADAIYKAITSYTHPKSVGIGGDVRLKKLEYEIQSIPGVVECVSTLLDNQPLNKPMQYPYCVVDLGGIVITLASSNGTSQTYYYNRAGGDGA